MTEQNADSRQPPAGTGFPPAGPSFPFFKHQRKGRSTVAKMIAIAALTLLLLIPLLLIRSVLGERLQRRDEAVYDITSTWGAAQVIAGPVLTVPYKYQYKVWQDKVLEGGKVEKVEVVETAVAEAGFLPVDLKVTGNLAPSVLHRGIYDAVVYAGELAMSGKFARPSFEDWKVRPENVLWEDAAVAFAVTDLRGVKEALTLKWDNRAIPLEPGARLADFQSAVHARLDGPAFGGDEAAFSLRLTINGSRGINFAPAGMQNEVRLASSWPDPSFRGSFLPSERKVGASGFEALWQVSYYGRSYPQKWSTQAGEAAFSSGAVNSSLFGVDLISVVDSYRLVERAIKYGILFIALVFTAFFLFEVLSRLRVHPFQYTLVGAAMCLFYLALLSLSEFVPFYLAYLAGAAASALMITLYSGRVLGSLRRASVIACELAAIYALLYMILCLQDYSLLFGTAGLFVALAIVMFMTRNIDWYARDEG